MGFLETLKSSFQQCLTTNSLLHFWLKFLQGAGHILCLDYDICQLGTECTTVQVYGQTTGRE